MSRVISFFKKILRIGIKHKISINHAYKFDYVHELEKFKTCIEEQSGNKIKLYKVEYTEYLDNYKLKATFILNGEINGNDT